VTSLAAEPALAEVMQDLGRRARAAARTLGLAPAETRARALRAMAAAIRAQEAAILAANDRDMAAATDKGLSGAMLDRLKLDAGRIAAMAKGLEDIAALPDPVGAVVAEWERPNGLRIA